MLKWNDKLFRRLQPFAQACFWLGLILELLIVIVDKSAYINPVEGLLFRLTFVLFGIKLVCSRYSLKELIWIAFFGIIAGLCYLASGRDEAVRLVAFVAAFQDVDVKKALKLAFWLTSAGCVVLMILSLTGIFGNLYILDEYDQMNLYCFGLGHPNAFYCMLWALMTLGIYLYHERMKWWHYGILAAVGGVFFVFTRSKTGILLLLFTLVLAVMLQYWKGLRETKWVYLAGIAGLLVCVGLSVWFACYTRYEGPFYPFVDHILTGRITTMNNWYDNGGVVFNWRLFSRPENTKYFDLGYVRLFYWYGIIPGAICVIMTILLIWNCYKRKDFMAFMVIASFVAYTMIEAHFVSVYLGRNYALFLLGACWPQLFADVGKKAVPRQTSVNQCAEGGQD